MSEKMRSYEAARSLFSFLAFLAWSVAVIGGVVALVSASGASQYGGSGAGLLAMVPGIGIAITGFLLVAFVQIGRANVDTAEYTQQMLKISRDQLDVSKQGLKLHSAAPQTFSAAAQREGAQDPKSSFAGQANEASQPGREIKEPKLEAPVAKTTVYQGKTIRAEKGKFLYNGIPFNTLPEAEKYIDSFAPLPEKTLAEVNQKT
ncbi:hypothetical protein KKW20_14670 [Planktotalea lamellibrachiae]|nr:hypothetical protein [Aliiroseovarius lamellibrachiae]